MKEKLIYLEWADAFRNDMGWMNEERALDWADNSNFFIKEAGFIIKETKEYIAIAMSVHEDDDGDIQYAGVQKIPKTWIRKRKVLKIN